MSAVYPHTVTVWCRAGDKDRRAVWRRRTLDGVRWQETRARSGDSVRDEVRLSVPAVFSGYVPASDVAAGKALGGGQWTLARGTRVALGQIMAASPPPSALSVESVSSAMVGTRIDHLEATAL